MRSGSEYRKPWIWLTLEGIKAVIVCEAVYFHVKTLVSSSSVFQLVCTCATNVIEGARLLLCTGALACFLGYGPFFLLIRSKASIK